MRPALTALLLTVPLILPAGAPASASTAPTCFGESATIVLGPEEDGVGTEHADVIVGGHDVRALGGDDRLCGFTGDAKAGRGRDRLEALPGTVAEAGRGADQVVTLSEPGAERVLAFPRRGSDTVLGGPGSDSVFAGRGRDLVRGGGGEDALHFNRGRNVGHGGPGDDVLFGGRGRDRLFGGPGDDSLSGGGHIETDEDFGDGGRGHDTCSYLEHRVRCEVVG